MHFFYHGRITRVGFFLISQVFSETGTLYSVRYRVYHTGYSRRLCDDDVRGGVEGGRTRQGNQSPRPRGTVQSILNAPIHTAPVVVPRAFVARTLQNKKGDFFFFDYHYFHAIGPPPPPETRRLAHGRTDNDGDDDDRQWRRATRDETSLLLRARPFGSNRVQSFRPRGVPTAGGSHVCVCARAESRPAEVAYTSGRRERSSVSVRGARVSFFPKTRTVRRLRFWIQVINGHRFFFRVPSTVFAFRFRPGRRTPVSCRVPTRPLRYRHFSSSLARADVGGGCTTESCFTGEYPQFCFRNNLNQLKSDLI